MSEELEKVIKEIEQLTEENKKLSEQMQKLMLRVKNLAQDMESASGAEKSMIADEIRELKMEYSVLNNKKARLQDELNIKRADYQRLSDQN